MANVDHEKRKRKILDAALDVFAEEGFQDITFQKIANKCGLTRTTLYIYYRNKQEIFVWSLKQVTAVIEEELHAIVGKKEYSAEQALRATFEKILDLISKNSRLFGALVSYLIYIKNEGATNIEKRILRRLIRLRHLINMVLIRGIKNGEFKRMKLSDANELLYGLIEATIFRLTIINQNDIATMRSVINLAIDGIIKK